MPEGRHRSSARPYLLVALLAAIVLGVVGFLALARGGTDLLSRATPEFSFRIARATGTSGTPGTKDRELADAAMAAAEKVEPVLSTFYASAFLDPENLSDAAYDEAWEAFDAAALPDARAAIETLTLGDLGPAFSDVQPADGVLRARVFFDAYGEPALLAANVVFTATATPGGEAAAPATIVSRGEFLLRESGGLWRIVAFRVDRADEDLPAATAAG
ncbi:MAG: hypothetical protein ACKO8G_05270 [Actinomycetota bacterium]